MALSVKSLTKVSLLAIAGLFVCGFLMVGCGDDPTGGRTGDQVETRARYIEDGATKYNPDQKQCPVCGAPDLHADQYVDVDGKRVYFDKQECREEFEQNQSKYLPKLQGGEEEEEMAGGESGGAAGGP